MALALSSRIQVYKGRAMTINTAEIEARLADKADALTVRLTVGELRALLAALTAANEKLAAARTTASFGMAECFEAADKFWVFYCNAGDANPDKHFMRQLSDRLQSAARKIERDLANTGDGNGR